LRNVTHSGAACEDAQSDALKRPFAGFSIPAENLAIMFTDIVDFTAKTSQQSREENARMAAAQKKLGIFDSCKAAAAKAALRKLEKP
jgi:hypothetical protein